MKPEELNAVSDTLFDAIASSNMSHTMASIDGDRPLIYVNQAFLDETGYTYEEVIGRNCRFLQGEGTDQETISEIKQALARFEPIDVEILNYKKDGTPFLNRLHMSTVFGEDGQPLAYMGIQCNVNDMVQNVRLAQERYRMESLGRFSANISHEIKNALQPIRLMLETMQQSDSLSAEELQKYITIAMDNMEIAEGTVKDVLHFSRESSLHTETITAAALTDNVLRFITGLLSKRITIDLDVGDEVRGNDALTLEINQSAVYQIVANIANNAIDAMEENGALRLSIHAEEIEGAADVLTGRYLRLAIEDNGGGIEEGVIGDIFQPFYSTKSPGEGTGLGLAVSMKLAKDSGGTITAENIEQQGARFTLYLPLAS